MAGRLQLVKSVIFPMQLYSFMLYVWPSSLLKEIQVCIKNFIWSGKQIKGNS